MKETWKPRLSLSDLSRIASFSQKRINPCILNDFGLFIETLNRFQTKQIAFLLLTKETWKPRLSLSDLFRIASLSQRLINPCSLNDFGLFRETLNRFQAKQFAFLQSMKETWKPRLSLSDLFQIASISQKLIYYCIQNDFGLFRETLNLFQTKQIAVLLLT